jgi:hypothetical protein
MLLHQAAAQVALMTGKQAPVEAMRAAGLAALGTQAHTGGRPASRQRNTSPG